MALPNVYYLADDTGSAGLGGQQVTCEFTAPTLAAATQVAYLVASAMQRSVRLVPKFGAPPYTLVTGVLPTVALTSVPSGIAI